MNEEECFVVYQELVNLLQNQDMNWVVRLAAEEISTGIIEQNRQYLAVREYTYKEQLKILIGLIKQSIVDTALIENKVINFFASNQYFSNLTPDVTFVSNVIDEESFSINNQSINSKVERANELLNLLQRITEEIDDGTER